MGIAVIEASEGVAEAALDAAEEEEEEEDSVVWCAVAAADACVVVCSVFGGSFMLTMTHEVDGSAADRVGGAAEVNVEGSCAMDRSQEGECGGMDSGEG